MNRFHRSLRITTLAAATAVALTAAPAAFAGRVDASALQAGGQYDRFIVKYREGSAEHADPTLVQRSLRSARERAAPLLGRQGAPSLGYLRRLAVGADVVRAGRKLDRDGAEALMRELAADPDVEYVELDQRLQRQFTPNDTRYGEQWHYFEATGGLNLPTAWDEATGTGTVVAVLDTGITSHPELNANVVAGYDFISDVTVAGDGNGRDSDPSDPGDFFGGYPSSWHGTHVAGTVAAVTNNSSGVAGVAFNAKISPVRVLGRGGGFTSDIADAVVWASGGSVGGVPANANPAEAINLSLGGAGSCGSTMQNAINGAVGRGTVVVVAAGNSNSNVSGFTPANCNNTVTVASNDRQGNRASYSNYGALIDVTAPGGETATPANGVLSTLNTGNTVPGSPTYAFYQGTSMAAPHVAGVVALIQSVVTKTPAEILSILQSSARPLPGSCTGGCGAGIVNAAAAIDAAQGGGGGGDTLQNGVPVPNLSGATGSERRWTMAVPAGASNLQFTIAGGSGDADLYVRYGSPPTTSTYNCRPYLNGNNETCTFAAPQAGTWHVMLRGYSAYAGVTLTGSYGTGGGGSFFENTTDHAINDNATIESPITVSGRSGNAPSNLQVGVTIYHTYRGDLRVDLVAPDGSVYNLHNRTGGSADNLIGTYTVNAASEPANGTWKLRVNDNANQDTGTLDKWSLQF